VTTPESRGNALLLPLFADPAEDHMLAAAEVGRPGVVRQALVPYLVRGTHLAASTSRTSPAR